MRVLRATFLLVVAASLLLFAFGEGYFGARQDGREPDRLSAQISPEKIRLVTRDMSVQRATTVSECREIRALPPDLALRIAEQVRPLADRIALTQTITEEPTSFWIYIPPLKSRQDADRRIAELRRQRVEDFYLVQESGPNQLAISLGLYRSEDAAKEALQGLASRGVRDARIAVRGVAQVTLRLRGQPENLGPFTAQVVTEFPSLEVAECKAGEG